MNEMNVLVTQSFKNAFIDRVRGLVNGEGNKLLVIKERYLLDQFMRLGEDMMLQLQCGVLLVKDFDDIKELDEKQMAELGWVRAETKPKIHLL